MVLILRSFSFHYFVDILRHVESNYFARAESTGTKAGRFWQGKPVCTNLRYFCRGYGQCILLEQHYRSNRPVPCVTVTCSGLDYGSLVSDANLHCKLQSSTFSDVFARVDSLVNRFQTYEAQQPCHAYLVGSQ